MTSPKNTRPYPWKCGHCRRKAVEKDVIAYDCKYEYDGRTYNLRIESLDVPRCKNCGELVFDVAANRQVTDALRREVGLLFPEQIRQNRESLGLRQRALANLIGVAESTLSRWETGAQIQQRSLDRLMRLFFASATVREQLGDTENLKRLGVTVSDQTMLSGSGTLEQSNPDTSGTDSSLALLINQLRQHMDRPDDDTPETLARWMRQSKTPHQQVPPESFSLRWTCVIAKHLTNFLIHESKYQIRPRTGKSPHTRLEPAQASPPIDPDVAELIPFFCTWAAYTEPRICSSWRTLFEKRLRSYERVATLSHPRERWFVAPLFSFGERDAEQADRLSLLASQFDVIPEGKRRDVLEELHRILALMAK